jgi:putative flippase GtrA
MIPQLLRFAVAGGGVTALSVAIYWLCAVPLHLSPFLANAIAYGLSMVAGYLLHSLWTFADRQGPGGAQRVAKFLVSNAVGFSLNSLWVWILVDWMKGPAWWPILPMAGVTPLVIFAISRAWVFR